MNLLLLHQEESQPPLVWLSDRRAEHLKQVLKVQPGDRVRAAVVNQGGVAAQVREVNDRGVLLELGVVVPWPKPIDHVVLAIPRPKALSRIVQIVSSFGVASISLINAWKVDKSYLSSPRLHPERLFEDMLLGCEQGQQCHAPLVRVIPRFSLFLEQQQELFRGAHHRIVLHPGAPKLLHAVLGPAPSTPDQPELSSVLVLGPDGGFLEQEVQGLVDRGYLPARLNVGPLRTEAAVAAALGVRSISRGPWSDLLPDTVAAPP